MTIEYIYILQYILLLYICSTYSDIRWRDPNIFYVEGFSSLMKYYELNSYDYISIPFTLG